MFTIAMTHGGPCAAVGVSDTIQLTQSGLSARQRVAELRRGVIMIYRDFKDIDEFSEELRSIADE